MVSDPAGNGFPGWKHLTLSAARFNPGEYGSLDTSFFNREAASSHYVDRSDRPIRTLKTTALVDTHSYALLDIHCSTHWPHDTQVGRWVVLYNAEQIKSLIGHKGYDDQ